jgi:endonuclease I
MNPLNCALSASLLASALVAQAPPGYYATVNTSTAATLRQTLHEVIDDHTRFPYTASSTDTWDILNQGDQNPTNSAHILDVYKNASYQKINGGVGAYNREHTWPKSYGFPNDQSDNYPYTDCHMLMLSDAGYNSARSNKPYEFADQFATEEPTLQTNGAGGGSGTYPGNSNWTDGSFSSGRWETWHDRRGDVARAILYADVRYEGGTHGATNANEPDLIVTNNQNLINSSNTGNNEQTAYMGMLTQLLTWHHADPVDQRERDRNDVVYSYQGNRNPFVDHPEWVDCIFANQCGDTTPPAAPTGLVASAGNAQVALDWADNTETDLAGYYVRRSTTAGGPYTQLNTSPLASSDYTDTGLTNGQVYHYVVVAVDTSNNISQQSGEAGATPVQPPSAPTVWINELHYDNEGADQFEFVELCGPAGANLAGWTLIAYNGSNGAIYGTQTLTGVIQDQSDGFGCLFFRMALQNGAPDGLALVDPALRVVQFLSYEGPMTATSGPAAGMTSTEIPTSEDATTRVGRSLQLQGFGNRYEQFTWSQPIVDSPGRPNRQQFFGDR